MTGRQSFVKEAPVNLIYVADFSRMGTTTDQEKEFYSAVDAGFISQNVYLYPVRNQITFNHYGYTNSVISNGVYCASEGLATVVRGNIDRPALARAMS